MSAKLKRDTHMDSAWMYRVYQNLAAASSFFFISSVFFLSSFQTSSLFPKGTVRHSKLKLNTNMKNGSVYCVY